MKKFKRYTKKQLIEFSKNNPVTNNYAFAERSGQYIVTANKKN